jgi:octaprenyl-diphosphate synthase
MSTAVAVPELSPASAVGAGVAPASAAGVFGRLAGHQAALDAFLREQLAEFEPEIRDLAAYSLDAAGKRIRPALVFLSGWQGPGAPTPELVRVAAVVEMVHLATLVHDDIMDGAEVRRNRPTVARRYGSAAAVLLGDALFAHALHLTTQFPTTAVCAAVSVAMRRVCAGEIVQTLRRGSLRVDRADYTRIVDLKTAELFRVSCQLGAEVAGHPAGFVAAASRFGRHLGIGYQIYDDLVDFFGEEARIGKTLGTDLTSGKLTLPLLVLRERLEPVEQERLAEELAGRRTPDLAGRLEQMRHLGVFERVAAEVAGELAAARAALAPWQSLAPAPRLGELADLLEAQVRSLAPGA